MRFQSYYRDLTAQEKRDLAEALQTSVAYLSQLANGHRKAGVKILSRITDATGGKLAWTDLRDD